MIAFCTLFFTSIGQGQTQADSAGQPPDDAVKSAELSTG